MSYRHHLFSFTKYCCHNCTISIFELKYSKFACFQSPICFTYSRLYASCIPTLTCSTYLYHVSWHVKMINKRTRYDTYHRRGKYQMLPFQLPMVQFGNRTYVSLVLITWHNDYSTTDSNSPSAVYLHETRCW